MLSTSVSHSLLKVLSRVARHTGSVAYVPEHGYLYINPRPMSHLEIATRRERTTTDEMSVVFWCRRGDLNSHEVTLTTP